MIMVNSISIKMLLLLVWQGKDDNEDLFHALKLLFTTTSEGKSQQKADGCDEVVNTINLCGDSKDWFSV
ncbi:CLUMA_CG002459, isoform A [Clunio marinus]|uniref:CLUMA_CG002459, isoform A n=1 Tax=Clunio marinus TaxID=568069 RepID=A0A1J1HKR6_9DIPT|nr:CLUMA_CG002459, isoform A [Clunio marinus]